MNISFGGLTLHPVNVPEYIFCISVLLLLIVTGIQAIVHVLAFLVKIILE
jgi:hypothetical protein